MYRELFQSGVMLVQGSPDRCLRIYTMDEFNKESEQYTAMPTLHRKGRDLRRHWFSGVHRAQLDQQSRVLIPPPLREYAELQGKVTIAGAGGWLEIWSPDLWRAEIARIADGLEVTQESVQEWQR
jgi:MraZ protein